MVTFWKGLIDVIDADRIWKKNKMPTWIDEKLAIAIKSETTT